MLVGSKKYRRPLSPILTCLIAACNVEPAARLRKISSQRTIAALLKEQITLFCERIDCLNGILVDASRKDSAPVKPALEIGDGAGEIDDRAGWASGVRQI